MAELDLLTGKGGNTRVSSRARGKSRARALHTDARMRVAGWIILLSHLHYVELCFAAVSSANHAFEQTEFGLLRIRATGPQRSARESWPEARSFYIVYVSDHRASILARTRTKPFTSFLLSVRCSFFDQGCNFLRPGNVDRVAGACDFDLVAVGSCGIPLLEVRVVGS